ncbi:MAG: glycerol-3-phosphate acyltransferase PlsX, partial [Alphaproteobacteria bacterium]
MGGDNAPHIVVAGANIARRRHPNVRFLLFGDREEIEPRVAKQRGLGEFVEIHHTP